MRLFIFLLGALILIGVPLLFYRLGSPPSTAPERMREAEVDDLELERSKERRDAESRGPLERLKDS